MICVDVWNTFFVVINMLKKVIPSSQFYFGVEKRILPKGEKIVKDDKLSITKKRITL